MRFFQTPGGNFVLAALVAAPLLAFADDTPATKTDAKSQSTDKADAKSTDKTTEKTPPTEVTTRLRGSRRPAHRYTAVAGTITVGSTDVQDAQLGMDGKPIPGSELAISEPKEPKDETAFARMF